MRRAMKLALGPRSLSDFIEEGSTFAQKVRGQNPNAKVNNRP